jgi:hypothetical protein
MIVMSFFLVLFLLAAFVIVVAIVLVSVNTPYTTEHYCSDEIRSMLDDEEGPYQIKQTVADELSVLFKTLTLKLSENKITWWVVRSTLLASERHGGMMPWTDRLEIAVLHDDLVKLVGMRKDLQESSARVKNSKLACFRNGYRYGTDMGSGIIFPYVNIDLLKATDIEMSLCTPLDELSECSFSDAYTRRREVFTKETVIPLQQDVPFALLRAATYPAMLGSNESKDNDDDFVLINIPAKPQQCVDVLFGGDAMTQIKQKRGVHLFRNAYVDAVVAKICG